MKLKSFLLLAAIFLFSMPSPAQSIRTPKTIKKTFYYSFNNVVSESQIENLKTSVASLKGVSEIKSDYDAENGRGQILVVVIEKEAAYEGDKLFSIRSLKSAIIKSELTPLEVIEEDNNTANQ